MKIKFLAIIASLFILPLAITSCLDSDNEYELGTDDTISAFALDTIYGVTYKFTIDQAKGEIYNQDSVPFSSDTIINKILIRTLSISTDLVVTGDSIFNQADSVDFKQTMTDEGVIKPLEFTVYAPNRETSKTYKIWVNRHRVDPDSVVWGTSPYKDGFSGGVISGGQETKTVSLGNDILVYVTNGTITSLYSKNNQWQSAINTNLDNMPILSSMTNFNNTLYVALEDGAIHRSLNGQTWELVPNQTLPTNISSTFKVKTIITTFYDINNKNLDKTLACIIEENSGTYFATATVSSQGELIWEKGEKVPYSTFDNSTKFPTGKLSATKSFATSTGGQQAMLVGNPSADDTATTPWFSEDGLDWGPMEVVDKYALPKWKEPTIIYYGNTLYAFGGAINADSNSENDFSTVYTSVNGIVWKEITRGFLFPNDNGVSKFKGRTDYSLTIDKDSYIWMTWGKEDEIWRGKLNRLTFIKQ